MAAGEQLRFGVENGDEVSALLCRPAKARRLLVLAHGAGAGMSHPFMEMLAADLAGMGVATLRYQFPYMEERRRVPDAPAVLKATVLAAVRAAAEAAPGLPLFAGGKSMGGRMTSQAAAQRPLNGVRGLVFFGFPLHPPNRPGTKRADHLANITVPMLFLQGTRDTLADLELLRPVCANLGSRATLHVIETADHSFHVLKSSGRNDAEVLRELAETVVTWAGGNEEIQSRLAQNPLSAEPAQKPLGN
jgi:predicted alpha/beta-hydrolase family hydrolase